MPNRHSLIRISGSKNSFRAHGNQIYGHQGQLLINNASVDQNHQQDDLILQLDYSDNRLASDAINSQVYF